MTSTELMDMTIVLVDDVKFNRQVVANLLEKMELTNFHQAANGKEALDIISGMEDENIIVISDFNMPVMHGLDLLKSVRTGKRKVNRSIPFAMLTGHSDEFLVDRAIALDVNAFVVKPISKTDLENRLVKMVQQINSEDWLKPQNHYEQIDIKSAVEMVRSRSASRPVPAGIVNHITEDIKNATLVKLPEVSANAILAQDLFMSDGRMLLHEGTKMSSILLSILADIGRLGHTLNAVWVKN